MCEEKHALEHGVMTLIGLVVVRCLLSLFVSILSLALPAFSAEPEKLTNLRQSWMQALQKGSSKVYASYMADLTKLQRGLKRSGKTKATEFLDVEIYRASSMSRSHGSVPFWPTESKIPGVSNARKVCDQKMLRMIRAKNKIYKKALEKLERKLDQELDEKGVKYVSKELAYFRKIDGKAKQEALSVLPRSKEQLKEYLLGSVWEVVEDDGKKGVIKLRENQYADMPWHEARWKATGTRNAELMHHQGNWKFKMVFSPDLQTISVSRPQDGGVRWTGKRTK